jgi:hypothetical protein
MSTCQAANYSGCYGSVLCTVNARLKETGRDRKMDKSISECGTLGKPPRFAVHKVVFIEYGVGSNSIDYSVLYLWRTPWRTPEGTRWLGMASRVENTSCTKLYSKCWVSNAEKALSPVPVYDYQGLLSL